MFACVRVWVRVCVCGCVCKCVRVCASVLRPERRGTVDCRRCVSHTLKLCESRRCRRTHAASSLEASMQGLLAAAPDLHAERGARPEAVQAVPTDNLCACTVDCERQTLWTVTTDNPCARAVDDAIQTTCRAPQKRVALAQRRNPRVPTSTLAHGRGQGQRYPQTMLARVQ